MPPVKKEHLIMSDVVCRSLQYTNRLNYGVSHDLDDLALMFQESLSHERLIHSIVGRIIFEQTEHPTQFARS